MQGGAAAFAWLAIVVGGLGLGGCQSTFEGAPPRVYPVPKVMANVRDTIEPLARQYYASADETERRRIRNDIVSGMMLACDMEYTEFENGLTRNRQLVGFSAGSGAIALNTAGTLIGGPTNQILSGVAGAVTGIKGQYDSEVIIAKTVQIVQAQMRANRDVVGKRLVEHMTLSTTDWPLALALSEVEEYYRAGTFTSGLIKATATAGNEATAAAADKASVYEFDYSPDANTAIIENYVLADPAKIAERRDALQKILTKLGYKKSLNVLRNDPAGAEYRARLVEEMRKLGLI